jgi:hypothetical protein
VDGIPAVSGPAAAWRPRPGTRGQIAAERAARFWPPDAARLPWVASAYPG